MSLTSLTAAATFSLLALVNGVQSQSATQSATATPSLAAFKVGSVYLPNNYLADFSDLSAAAIQDMNSNDQYGVSYENCGNEIHAAFNFVGEVYSKYALSPEFFAAMKYVEEIAGDVPPAQNYIQSLKNWTLTAQTFYNKTANQEFAQWAATSTSMFHTTTTTTSIAAANTQGASGASAPSSQSAVPFGAVSAGPSGATVNTPAQDAAPHAFGVVDASTSSATVKSLIGSIILGASALVLAIL